MYSRGGVWNHKIFDIKNYATVPYAKSKLEKVTVNCDTALVAYLCG